MAETLSQREVLDIATTIGYYILKYGGNITRLDFDFVGFPTLSPLGKIARKYSKADLKPSPPHFILLQMPQSRTAKYPTRTPRSLSFHPNSSQI